MRGYNTTDHKGNLLSTSWFAGTNKGLRCPVDGCDHTGEVITKAHCRIVHGMERDAYDKKGKKVANSVQAIYGMPIIVESKSEIVSQNNGRSKWYSIDSGMGVL